MRERERERETQGVRSRKVEIVSYRQKGELSREVLCHAAREGIACNMQHVTYSTHSVVLSMYECLRHHSNTSTYFST